MRQNDISKSVIVKNALGSYHQQEYSPSFQKMMSKAVNRIYKKRTIQTDLPHQTPHGSPPKNTLLRDIQVHLWSREDNTDLPVKISSFFQVPLKESTGFSNQKRGTLRLDPLQSKHKEHTNQGKHPMLLNYKLQRYQTLDRHATKSVDDLISEIKVILRGPASLHKAKNAEDSQSESKIKKCKLLHRQKPKRSYLLIQPIAPRQRQRTEGAHWSPWGSQKEEEEN